MRFFIFLLISLGSFSANSAEPTLNVGDTAENWSLQTKDGEALDYYQDSEGKVSVILFWATWCPYCARLMPHLEDVYHLYQDKGLKFYAIDIFEDGEIDPVSHFDKKGFTYTLLLNGDLVAEDYGVKGTPGLFVIGKDKKIIYVRKSGMSDAQVKQDISRSIQQALEN